MNKKVNVVLIAILLFSASAFGTILLNENFNYPAGDTLTNHGWYEINIGEVIICVTPGLTYTGYLNSGIGNAAKVDTSGPGQEIDKSFDVQTSGTVYAGFIVKVTKATDTGDCFIFLSQHLDGGFGLVYIKKNGSVFKFGLSKGNESPSYTSNSFYFDSIYLIVLKYNFLDYIDDDEVSLYVFSQNSPSPLPVNEPITPEIGPLSSNWDALEISAVNLYQGTDVYAPREIIDGIRIGQSWVDIIPSSIPTLISPVNDTLINDDTPTFIWNLLSDAVLYNLVINDGTKAEVYNVETADTSCTVDSSFFDGVYSWTVRAKDTLNNWGAFATPWSFSIYLVPSSPTLISPEDNALLNNQTPTFKWNMVSDAVLYNLTVDDDLEAEVYNIETTDTTYTVDSSFYEGIYIWTVRAKDSLDNWGFMATPRSFTIDTTPPGAPVLVSPTNGSTTNDMTPTFDWNSVSDGVKYQLIVETSKAVVINETLDVTDFTPTSNLNEGSYSWKVKARDAAGNWGSYSSSWTFTVDTTPPGAPVLVSPTNSSTITDMTPTFDWNPVSGGIKYNLIVETGKAVIINETLDMTDFTPTSNLDEGSYSWKVKARDAVNNWSAYSSSWTLTIDTTPPSIPVLVSPSNASSTNDMTPIFDWNSVSGGVKYNLIVENGKAVIINETLDVTDFTPTSNLNEGTYSWKTKARDTAGNWSVYSSPWTFTIDTTPPAIPLQLIPPDDTTLNDNTPYFDWSDVSGAAQYHIQVDNDFDFLSTTINEQVISSDWQVLAGNEMASDTYYWRVSATDSTGNWSDYSSVWMFTINITSPSVPILISPEDSAYFNNPTPTFIWSGVVLDDTNNLVVDGPTKTGFDTITTDTTYTPSTNLGEGTCSWKVRTKNSGIWSGFSPPYTFTIDTTPPGAPVLVSPLNGSTTNDQTPPFNWDSVIGGVKYNLIVDTGAVVVINETLDVTEFTPTSNLDVGLYSWKVKAKDAAANWGSYSSYWTFTIDTSGTPAPTLISPEDNAFVTTIVPTFIWNGVTSGDTNNLVVEGPSKTGFDIIVTDTIFVSSIALNETSYTWKVRTKHFGIWSDFSSSRIFTIDTTPPLPPLALAPGNGSMLAFTPDTIWWRSVNDAVLYNIEVRDTVIWSPKDTLPEIVKDGGALVGIGDNYIYAFPGSKTNKFLMYTIGAKAGWSEKETLPFGYKHPLADPPKLQKKFPGKGASLCYDGINTIYATRGNSTKQFWSYSISGNTWTPESFVPVPKALKGGTSIQYYKGKVYLLAGGQKKTDLHNFFVFDTTTRIWSPLRSLELGFYNKVWKDGSSIAELEGNIYALKGGDKKSNPFYMYDTRTNIWIMKESLPIADTVFGKYKKTVLVKDGGASVSDGNVIYAMKGGKTGTFWKYTPGPPDNWSRDRSIPKLDSMDKKSVPSTGAALAYADSSIWLLKGNKKNEFWRFGSIRSFDNKTVGAIINAFTVDTFYATTTELGEGSYAWSIRSKDLPGNWSQFSDDWTFTIAHKNSKRPFSTIVPVNERTITRDNVNIDVAPNPFIKFTTINYSVPVSGNVSIKLYNSSGRLIKTLVNDNLNAGIYSFKLTTGKLAKGVYFIKYDSDQNKAEVKLIIQ